MEISQIQELTLDELEAVAGGGFWADVGDFFHGLWDGLTSEANKKAS